MAVKLMFSNASDSYIQAVEDKINTVKEFNAPTFNAVRGRLSKKKAGEKGIKIVYDELISGGHSTPTAMRPDYNEPVADGEFASYVYPTRYRLPIKIDHGILRDIAAKSKPAADKLARKLTNKTLQAIKRLNRNMYGDGSGALAFSASNITAVGSASMNCATTPAATFGQTKGGMWLLKDNWYQAINAATGLPRGLFQVTVQGRTSVTINLVAGAVSSGDPIVDVNTYNGWFRGFAHLISGTSRNVQGINTADYPDMNSTELDLSGAPFTFSVVEDICTMLRIRNNGDEKSGKVMFMSPGQESVVRKSAQNLRVYNDGSNVARGIQENVDFGTNLNVVLDADCDEDRVYAIAYEEFGMLEEQPLGDMDYDGQTWHQLLGANNAGSDTYTKAIGWDGNIYRKGNAMTSALVKRASITGVRTQVNS